MPSNPWTLSPARCFAANPTRRAVARELYARVEVLPLISPHVHVPPAQLADPDARLGTPAELFIIPDHYVIDHTPAGRFGEPDDLIGTLIWLGGPGASFVNGIVVPVDGVLVPSAVYKTTQGA
jgi:NAD(P)-dependent dehydrogenase (short-subunit alcohol dehydrogenase family)